jgi:hypothetical protein
MNQTATYTPTARHYRKNTWQKTFEVTANEAQARTLNHFVKNELAYYQLLSGQLGIRMRAFPEDFVSNTPSVERLWLFAAKYSVTANTLKAQPQAKWPSDIANSWGAMWNRNGEYLLSSGAEAIMNLLATQCHLHADVRRNIAEEVLESIKHQAEILHAAQNTVELRSPVQTLPEHDHFTKRHVQVPRRLAKFVFNAMTGNTEVTIPYCRDPLLIPGQDVSETKWDIMVISQVNREADQNHMLQVSLRTSRNRYLITYTDGQRPNRLARM